MYEKVLWIPKTARNKNDSFQKEKKWSYKQKSSKNHMTMQKPVIFGKKNLKINIWKINIIVQLEIIFVIHHYTREYIGA